MAPRKRNNNNSTVLSINNVNLGPNEKQKSNYKTISYKVKGKK